MLLKLDLRMRRIEDSLERDIAKYIIESQDMYFFWFLISKFGLIAMVICNLKIKIRFVFVIRFITHNILCMIILKNGINSNIIFST